MHQEVESTRLNQSSLPSPGTDPSEHFCPPTGALLSSEGSKLQNLKLGLPQTSSMDVQFSERNFSAWRHQKETWSFKRQQQDQLLSVSRGCHRRLEKADMKGNGLISDTWASFRQILTLRWGEEKLSWYYFIFFSHGINLTSLPRKLAQSTH